MKPRIGGTSYQRSREGEFELGLPLIGPKLVQVSWAHEVIPEDGFKISLIIWLSMAHVHTFTSNLVS